MLYNGDLYKNRTFDTNKLKEYGFESIENYYLFKTTIMNGTFELIVKISDGYVDIKVVEVLTETDYDLIFVKNVQGEFVGKVKNELENVLLNIAEKCTIINIFKSEYSYKVIEYINKTYGDNPEYLWEKFPNNAIFRRKDKKGKWYAAILTVSKQKLGIDGRGEIEIIDLKEKPDVIKNLVDNKKYFLGYHMNKKHWYTICLDGSVPLKEIYKYVDKSYDLLK